MVNLSQKRGQAIRSLRRAVTDELNNPEFFKSVGAANPRMPTKIKKRIKACQKYGLTLEQIRGVVLEEIDKYAKKYFYNIPS